MSTAFRVRRERVDVGGRARAVLVYASDLHLGWPWTRGVPRLLAEVVRDLRPDALLLGGDLCDGARALPALSELVHRCAAFAPVLAIPGNHDRRAGTDRVRAAVLDGGGLWLRDTPWYAEGLAVEGRPSAGARERVRVLCAHEPAVIEKARGSFDLVLAGHLHGGQMVWFERGGRLYPYGWIDPWNGPRFEVGDTTLIVSRGAADSLPLRWRCPREVLACELV